jgi:hypothetical protein
MDKPSVVSFTIWALSDIVFMGAIVEKELLVDFFNLIGRKKPRNFNTGYYMLSAVLNSTTVVVFFFYCAKYDVGLEPIILVTAYKFQIRI